MEVALKMRHHSGQTGQTGQTRQIGQTGLTGQTTQTTQMSQVCDKSHGHDEECWSRELLTEPQEFAEHLGQILLEVLEQQVAPILDQLELLCVRCSVCSVYMRVNEEK